MSIHPIQLILLGGIAISLVLAVKVLRHQLMGRLFFIAQFLVGAFFVLVPEQTEFVANWVGVGRGADLMFYLFIVFTYMSGFCVLAKFRTLERNQTRLVREMALGNVRFGGEKP